MHLIRKQLKAHFRNVLVLELTIFSLHALMKSFSTPWEKFGDNGFFIPLSPHLFQIFSLVMQRWFKVYKNYGRRLNECITILAIFVSIWKNYACGKKMVKLSDSTSGRLSMKNFALSIVLNVSEVQHCRKCRILLDRNNLEKI